MFDAVISAMCIFYFCLMRGGYFGVWILPKSISSHPLFQVSHNFVSFALMWADRPFQLGLLLTKTGEQHEKT